MLFFGEFLREAAHTAAKSLTNLSTANGPIGPEVASPSVVHGHNFIETWQVTLLLDRLQTPDISQTVRVNCRCASQFGLAKTFSGENPKQPGT